MPHHNIKRGNGLQRHTLDSRIVLVNEVGLDQLDGQARLAHTTAADDDELVFSEKLSLDAALLLVHPVIHQLQGESHTLDDIFRD